MIHFTLRQVFVFDAVAKHLSYSRAAALLHLTQPAVSMQIRQLEENVGIELLEQLGKKIFLTEAGRAFHSHCQNILSELNDAEAILADIKGMYGKFSICVASTAAYVAPKLLAEFCRQHPKAQVSLSVTNREMLLQRLADNEADMAIMGRPPESGGLDAIPFMENQLVVIAPPEHPLIGIYPIPLSMLEQETFLVREQGSGTRIAMERFFLEHRMRLLTGTEMNTNEAIKQAVQFGMGLGVVSLHTISLELETGKLKTLDVEGFPIKRYWYIVHRKDKHLSSVARSFKSFLLEKTNQN